MNIHLTIKSVLCTVFLFINSAQTATITVDGTDGAVAVDGVCSISEAIQAANTDMIVDTCLAGSGTDTINLGTDITLTAAFENDATFGSTGTPAITSPIILDGMGFSIVRDDNLICTLDSSNDTSEFRLMRIDASGDLILNNITLSNGCADRSSGVGRFGGAILNDGLLSLENSTFSGNEANQGGGVFNDDTITTIQNSTFSENSALIGGGVFNRETITTIQNSTFSGNEANQGGGIFNRETITTIQKCTFSGNSANSGGGIHNNGIITTMQNSTFSGNEANSSGGGVYNRETITTIQNNTFSGNSATNNGAGIRNNNGTIGTLRNSLFHQNTSGGTECANGGSGSINGSNNLSDNIGNDCPDVSTILTTSTVGPLADNGGPTMTHALLANSEALDAGDVDSTATDQRGIAASGIRDIGAFELRPPDLCPVALQTDGFTTSVANPAELIEAIECANINGSGADTINLGTDITLTAVFENDGFGSTGTPAITSSIILDGMGFSIVRDANLNCTLDSSNDSSEFRLMRIDASGDLTLNNITLSNGCANGSGDVSFGGAILNDGVLSLENSTFSENSALFGGGISNRETITTIQNSTFSGNEANQGGGIFNRETITTIQKCTFSGNSANSGGGIYNNDTITTIQNSTFSGNEADSLGGGIYNINNITTIQNSTFSGNSAVSNGAGIRNVNGIIGTLRNSLFHQNTGGGTECANGGTGSVNGSNNLSDNISSDCPDVSTTLTTATVGPLADNGGPTMTHALLVGSQALDAGDGNSTSTDQRGLALNGVRDIGAFEAQVFELCPTALMVDGFTTMVNGAAALIVAMECANLNGNNPDTINLGTDITLLEEYENDTTFGRTGTPAIYTHTILDGKGFILWRDNVVCNNDGVEDTGEFRLLRNASVDNFTLQNITLSNGCADGSMGDTGAGAAIINAEIMNIYKTSFINNHATTVGGALYNFGVTNTIADSTFSANSAVVSGGAIQNKFGAINQILNSSFVGNSAPLGAAIDNDQAINTLNNSLFSLNDSNECDGLVAGLNNLSDSAGCPGLLFPLLVPATVDSLADNNGIMMHALLPGSQAIDASDTITATSTDQRRYGANGTRDIGAYEFNGTPWFFQDGFEDQP